MNKNYIDSVKFNDVVTRLRRFFMNKGFIEVHTQDRLSILAACEDPTTIATYEYEGQIWPLPQTGQMWLEYELLNNPALPGVFCVSTSYRQEPNPIPGRHNTIFPMFEFESRGTMLDLMMIERDLIHDFGIEDKYCIPIINYDDLSYQYETRELTTEHEEKIWKDYGPAVFITDFPQYTSPFWNMKKNGEHANKIDVILCGMETIGSAERSSDPEEMRKLFYSISDGQYANILYEKFGKERVDNELKEFLSHNFFPRYGGGIGITRLIRALDLI